MIINDNFFFLVHLFSTDVAPVGGKVHKSRKYSYSKSYARSLRVLSGHNVWPCKQRIWRTLHCQNQSDWKSLFLTPGCSLALNGCKFFWTNILERRRWIFWYFSLCCSFWSPPPALSGVYQHQWPPLSGMLSRVTSMPGETVYIPSFSSRFKNQIPGLYSRQIAPQK